MAYCGCRAAQHLFVGSGRVGPSERPRYPLRQRTRNETRLPANKHNPANSTLSQTSPLPNISATANSRYHHTVSTRARTRVLLNNGNRHPKPGPKPTPRHHQRTTTTTTTNPTTTALPSPPPKTNPPHPRAPRSPSTRSLRRPPAAHARQAVLPERSGLLPDHRGQGAGDAARRPRPDGFPPGSQVREGV
jgi:hypothetical protein